MKAKGHTILSLLLSVAMLFSMIPMTSLAADESACLNHQIHTIDCGYQKAIPKTVCTHVHDKECGFTEETLERACNFVGDEAETETAIQTDISEHSHDVNCAYAKASLPTPCTHEHNAECGHQEAIDAGICTHVCELCSEQLLETTLDQEFPAKNSNPPDALLPAMEQGMPWQIQAPMNLSLQRAETMSFYIQVFDENGTSLQGTAKYQPGLMSEYPSHNTPNKFGTVNVSPIKSENDEYTYFSYGTNDLYKEPSNPTVQLPINKSLIKVHLALKSSDDETIIDLVIAPNDSAYPEDPMNPSGGAVTKKILKGRVIDQDDSGVVDADVTAQHMYMPPIKTVKTDNNGNYSIELPETQFGTFSLSAYKKGYGMSGTYSFDFVGCDASKNYDFKATDLGTIPEVNYKKLNCSISGAGNSVTTEVTLEITGMETETFTIKGSNSYSKELDKVLYAGKTITLTPKARGYRFEPVSQSFRFDAYGSEIPVSFVCKTDGTRILSISAAEHSDNKTDIHNVKYKVTAGDVCEYYVGGQAALIELYDAFYLNKYITVVPSKEGYTFDPPYITFLYAPGESSYTKAFQGSSILDASKKTLTVIVTDDKTGNPISDVSISLGSITSDKKTDSKGLWKLEGLTEQNFPNGTEELKLSKLGYEFAPRWLAFGDVGTIAISQSEAINNNKQTVNVVLNAKPEVGGKVYGGGEIPLNGLVHLTAVPNVGYKFLGWSVHPSDSIYYLNANTSFVPQSYLKWQGNFIKDNSAVAATTKKLTIAANIANAGSATGSGDYTINTNVILYAKANTGYKFSHWTENNKVLSVNSYYQITTTAEDRSIMAVFKEIGGTSTDAKYQIATTANPTIGGTVFGSGEYIKNTSITVMASPNNDYKFVNWTESGNEVSTSSNYPFSVDSDRTLVANFVKSTDPDKPDPDKPDPDKPDPDKPDPDKPDPDKPDPDKPDPDKPSPDKPSPDKPSPDKPKPNKPNSGGGSSDSDLKPQTVPTQGSGEVAVAVDKNGSASANIANDTIARAIKMAQDEARRKGIEKNGIAITINVKNDKSANSFDVNLPKVSIDLLVDAKIKEIKIQGDTLGVTINLLALQEIQKNIDSDVIINVRKADVKKLSSTVETAIGNRPIFDISIKGKNGKNISRLRNGKISITIPYILGKNEKTENIYGAFVNSKGNASKVIGSKYDSINKSLSFSTKHFSTYGVAYKADSETWMSTINYEFDRNVISSIRNIFLF